MSTAPDSLVVNDPVDFRSVDGFRQYSYTLVYGTGKLGVTDSGSVFLASVAQGKLTGIRVTSLSTNFAVSLRTKTGVTLPSVKQIYQHSAINLAWAEYGLEILFSNEDTTQLEGLYLVVTNSAGTTRDVEVDLFISPM